VSLRRPLPPFVKGDLSAQVTTTSFGDFSRIAEGLDGGTGFGLGSEAKCEEIWERRSWALFGAVTCQHLKLVVEMGEGIPCAMVGRDCVSWVQGELVLKLVFVIGMQRC
jgi:hypothetical protein